MNQIPDRESRRKIHLRQNGNSVSEKLPPPDLWSFPLAVSRHWAWIMLSAVVAGVLGFQLWNAYWDNEYVATAQLIRTESPENYLAPVQHIAGPALNGIIDSTAVHRRVGVQMRPILTAREVAKLVEIEASRNNDLINVSVSLPDQKKAIQFVNTYIDEAAMITREMQAEEATGVYQNLEKQLALVKEEIASVQTALSSQPNLAFHGQDIAGAAPSRSLALFGRLEDAGDELLYLLGRYTHAHPLVREQRARVEMLEQQIAELSVNEPGGGADAVLSTVAGNQYGDGLVSGLVALEAQRVLISGRMRVTKVIAENPPGFIQVFAPASEKDVDVTSAIPLIAFGTLTTSLFGLVLMGGFFMTVELFDKRMKSPSDILRVTKLPILAVLGRKRWKRAEVRNQWAFRTWTSLQNNLSATPNSGLICGFTSSRPKEGRTLWVNALADAANNCGFRVLTITTEDLAKKNRWKSAKNANGKKKNGSTPTSEETALASNWMYSPAEITRRVAAPGHPPVVHIPLPGWVWNLNRRKEWFAALEEWRRIENLVILIELPPASSPEAVLLAQNLPNLVWLVDSRKARAPETQEQLQTLRNARCNLVGAVVNRAPGSFQSNRFARWGSTAVAMVCLLAMLFHPTSQLQAEPEGETLGGESSGLPSAGGPVEQTQAEERDPTSASRQFSVDTPRERADWQRGLTLGPGDMLQISLVGYPELTRDPIVIQSNGQIGFLEVHTLQAAGLSVDELRSNLDEALGEFRRSPRTMVVPTAYESKKYYMLGRIARTGTYSLNRPLTIVEAVARAEGFQTGLTGSGHGELVDLSRSFLVRDGERYDVDFKELFAAGNLEHNILVEPNDYFYFPPVRMQEVYLLGAFERQGPVEFTEGLSVVRAVATRGGLTRRAWKQKILLVRGSLGDPETFHVSIKDVLDGKEADVPLMAGDIIYVSERPWIRAEQLLDDVVSAFAQTVTIHWTSNNIISP
ncbi:MAG: polysaccharide biosynthesis/export family protein [Opitutales bacterium]|nr:polysaccharide biosynthesis/export family protein [Opitutales bacterium]